MHPVDTPRSLVAKLKDVRVVLPHPAMGHYRGAVVVVADDQVLGEAAVQTPSGLGEGLTYLLWGHDVPPLSPPSLGERKRNDSTLAGEFPVRLVLWAALWIEPLRAASRTARHLHPHC
jgi:hypothetical protein